MAVNPSRPPRREIMIKFFLLCSEALEEKFMPVKKTLADPPIKKFLLVQFTLLTSPKNCKLLPTYFYTHPDYSIIYRFFHID